MVPRPLSCALLLASVLALCGHPPRQEPPGAIADDRDPDRVVGTVGGPVIDTPDGFGAPLDAGNTVVWIWTTEVIEPGERVAVSGRLRTPRGFLDPGNEDRANLVAARGAEWELTATRVERLGHDDGITTWAWRWAARMQRRWSARIEGTAARQRKAPSSQPDPAREALDGIVTGDRERVPPGLDQRWRAIGIYHVLSVSGLHLAVVAGLLFWLLRRLIAASPWGGRIRPARWAAPLSILFAIAYTLITGGQLATVRALVVVVLALVGQMLDRPLRLVDALGLAAIAILVWRPQDLYDPSFQLSFIAALTLALRPRVTATGRVRRWVVGGFATSAWVALTTAPITALHFHQVAAGGVIGNLVLTPLVEMIALPLGMAGVLLGSISRSLGALLINIAAWIVGRVDQLAGALAHGVPVGNIALGSPLVVIALVVLSVWLAARKRRGWLDIAAWVVGCALWMFGRVPAPTDTLRVTFLDVGQGDAAIIELPGGDGVWLVDAGGAASARTFEAATAPGRAITRTLEVYGNDAVDLAILSHPHPDHYLGFAAIDLPVHELWAVTGTEPSGAGDAMPHGHRTTMPSFGAVEALLVARGTRVVTPALGTTRTAHGVQLTVWAPRYQPDASGPVALGFDPVRSVNDNSLVVTITYAGRTILFTGDIEAEGEEALVAAGLSHVDVVKVAHHGSPTSSSSPFVTATSPAYAVVSCGLANAFGFPSPDVLARWRSVGTRIERTDLDGAVSVTVFPDGTLDVDRFAH